MLNVAVWYERWSLDSEMCWLRSFASAVVCDDRHKCDVDVYMVTGMISRTLMQLRAKNVCESIFSRLPAMQYDMCVTDVGVQQRWSATTPKKATKQQIRSSRTSEQQKKADLSECHPEMTEAPYHAPHTVQRPALVPATA